MNQKLKLALDLGPLLVFFICYRMGGLATATVGLIGCTAISLAITYVREKKIAPVPLISGIAVALLGSLTLFLHDEFFIKVKPTLVNLLFASFLFGGLYFGKIWLKYMLGSALTISDRGWKILTIRWGFFFVFLAALNECIWRNYPTDFWVSFKVFGMFSLTMLFTFSQYPLIKKYWVDEEDKTI